MPAPPVRRWQEAPALAVEKLCFTAPLAITGCMGKHASRQTVCLFYCFLCFTTVLTAFAFDKKRCSTHPKCHCRQLGKH